MFSYTTLNLSKITIVYPFKELKKKKRLPGTLLKPLGKVLILFCGSFCPVTNSFFSVFPFSKVIDCYFAF